MCWASLESSKQFTIDSGHAGARNFQKSKIVIFQKRQAKKKTFCSDWQNEKVQKPKQAFFVDLTMDSCSPLQDASIDPPHSVVWCWSCLSKLSKCENCDWQDHLSLSVLFQPPTPFSCHSQCRHDSTKQWWHLDWRNLPPCIWWRWNKLHQLCSWHFHISSHVHIAVLQLRKGLLSKCLLYKWYLLCEEKRTWATNTTVSAYEPGRWYVPEALMLCIGCRQCSVAHCTHWLVIARTQQKLMF